MAEERSAGGESAWGDGLPAGSCVWMVTLSPWIENREEAQLIQDQASSAWKHPGKTCQGFTKERTVRSCHVLRSCLRGGAAQSTSPFPL